MLLKKQLIVIWCIALLALCATMNAQESPENLATIIYNGIQFTYEPAAFGAVLPGYDEGTPYEKQAPYFANVASHTFFKFMRPDPSRPDINWIGELRVYRLADLEVYAEPSYREVVEQLRNLDMDNLGAFVTVGTDYRIPTLPFMPVLNATQAFRIHPAARRFETAAGIDYYAYYNVTVEPILEGQVMYSYQAITEDGEYYLSFSMPVETGLLEPALPEDIDWDAFSANYTRYLQDMFTAMNNADPATFAPSSDVLTNFIKSISTAG